ncbi:MAG TPA: arylmalonate decarboxylase, partial [Gammaproteobacteria bacterium]|nr:arylmalonate decarboxylase [Gammaproteobacteria bacterium]
MAKIAAVAEKSMGKPVIAINTALYWHALRSMGIDDSISNFGRLLEQH